MKKSNILWSEKIKNADGTFTTKEVFKKATKCGELSFITTFKKKKMPISQLSYSDTNFKKLCRTSKFKYNPDESYIQYEVYEEKQDGVWFSIIGEFDKNHKQLKAKEFYDKKFKDLYITGEWEYLNDGGCIEKVADYSYGESVERKYNDKHNKISEIKFLDTDFKKAEEKFSFEYKNNLLVKKTSKVCLDLNNATYTTKFEYNKKKQKVCQYVFQDEDIFYKTTYEYLKNGDCITTGYDSAGNLYYKYQLDKEDSTKYKAEYTDGIITTETTYKSLKNEDKLVYYTNYNNNSSKIKKYNANYRLQLVKYYNSPNFRNLHSTETYKYLKNGKMYVYSKLSAKKTDKDFYSAIEICNKNGNKIKAKYYKDRNFKKLLRVENL